MFLPKSRSSQWRCKFPKHNVGKEGEKTSNVKQGKCINEDGHTKHKAYH